MPQQFHLHHSIFHRHRFHRKPLGTDHFGSWFLIKFSLDRWAGFTFLIIFAFVTFDLTVNDRDYFIDGNQ